MNRARWLLLFLCLAACAASVPAFPGYGYDGNQVQSSPSPSPAPTATPTATPTPPPISSFAPSISNATFPNAAATPLLITMTGGGASNYALTGCGIGSAVQCVTSGRNVIVWPTTIGGTATLGVNDGTNSASIPITVATPNAFSGVLVAITPQPTSAATVTALESGRIADGFDWNLTNTSGNASAEQAVQTYWSYAAWGTTAYAPQHVRDATVGSGGTYYINSGDVALDNALFHAYGTCNLTGLDFVPDNIATSYASNIQCTDAYAPTNEHDSDQAFYQILKTATSAGARTVNVTTEGGNPGKVSPEYGQVLVGDGPSAEVATVTSNGSGSGQLTFAVPLSISHPGGAGASLAKGVPGATAPPTIAATGAPYATPPPTPTPLPSATPYPLVVNVQQGLAAVQVGNWGTLNCGGSNYVVGQNGGREEAVHVVSIPSPLPSTGTTTIGLDAKPYYAYASGTPFILGCVEHYPREQYWYASDYLAQTTQLSALFGTSGAPILSGADAFPLHNNAWAPQTYGYATSTLTQAGAGHVYMYDHTPAEPDGLGTGDTPNETCSGHQVPAYGFAGGLCGVLQQTGYFGAAAAQPAYATEYGQSQVPVGSSPDPGAVDDLPYDASDAITSGETLWMLTHGYARAYQFTLLKTVTQPYQDDSYIRCSNNGGYFPCTGSGVVVPTPAYLTRQGEFDLLSDPNCVFPACRFIPDTVMFHVNTNLPGPDTVKGGNGYQLIVQLMEDSTGRFIIWYQEAQNVYKYTDSGSCNSDSECYAAPSPAPFRLFINGAHTTFSNCANYMVDNSVPTAENTTAPQDSNWGVVGLATPNAQFGALNPTPTFAPTDDGVNLIATYDAGFDVCNTTYRPVPVGVRTPHP